MSGHPGKLPARDFEEIRLAEALERGRCPICDARQEASYAALRGLAREGATDRGLRDIGVAAGGQGRRPRSS